MVLESANKILTRSDRIMGSLITVLGRRPLADVKLYREFAVLDVHGSRCNGDGNHMSVSANNQPADVTASKVRG
jgi:hypothetical protein